MDYIKKLKSMLLNVNNIDGHSLQNAMKLERIFNSLGDIITQIPKPYDGRYSDIKDGMADASANYITGRKHVADFYLGKKQLLDDIKAVIERYSKDNNLSA